METSRNHNLPEHPLRHYSPANECIYCSSRERLTREHIIPLSAGGRWIFPKSSCQDCAAITGAFEGEFTRTILGPLRMLYNMPTRRPKDRPQHLSLSVKYPDSTDWEIAQVDRSVCPFLVGLPIYPMPDLLTGSVTEGDRGAATSRIWIRGGGFWPDKDAHLQWLCEMLGASEVMPSATVHTEPFCLVLAKIAHAFTVAEMGVGSFDPFLTKMVLERDLSKRADFIGGGRGDEPPSSTLHELDFDQTCSSDGDIIAVQIRLLALLGTPTYHVAVGRRR